MTGDGAIVRVLTDRRRLWLADCMAILRMMILIGQIKNRKLFRTKSVLDLNFNQQNFLASHKFIPRDFIPKMACHQSVVNAQGKAYDKKIDYSHGILLDK